MPNAVENFEQGAEILQQVDVSKIFTSMAMGIAEAQQKLDNNSIAQMLKLAEQKVAGRSLIELGFVPAFYSFTSADIQCNINLQMGLKTDFEGSLHFEITNAQKKGFSREQSEKFMENRTQKERYEFKSSRDFAMKAGESKAITINSKDYIIEQGNERNTSVEELTDNIRESNEIDRVNYEVASNFKFTNNNENSKSIIVRYTGGYITVYIPPVEGILQIAKYPDGSDMGTEIDLNGSDANASFNVKEDFKKTYEEANEKLGDGSIAGIEQTKGFTDDGTNYKELKFYFDFDKSNIDFTYSDSGFSNDELMFRILAAILKGDTDQKLNITGNTDSSGPGEYNKKLGMDRAEKVKSYLVSLGANTDNITTESLGEKTALAEGNDNIKNVKYRNVTFNLKKKADYIYFSGGHFTNEATPNTENGDKNYFLYINDEETKVINFVFTDENDEEHESNHTITDDASVETIYSVESSKFKYEKLRNVNYLLYKNTEITYSLFSNSSEEINIESKYESDSTTSENESKYLIGENINNTSLLKYDAQKLNTDNSIAFAGSLDVRYSRQFEMSIEGNASMSAHIAAVPPPKQFTERVLNNLTSQT